MTATAISIEVGDKVEPRQFGPISRTDFVMYQGASGDFQPFHHDEEYARAAGFPTVFSVGMFQAGLLGTFATDWLGAATIRRFAVRFHEQCWPGDLLTCEGTVTSVETTSDGRLVEIDLQCVRQTGGIAVTGKAQFLLSQQPPETPSRETP